MGTQTSLVPKSAESLSHADLLARLQGVVEDSKTQNFAYLQFQGNKGIYLIPNGTDEPDELPKDTEVLLNIFQSRHGWVCWKDGKPIDTVEVGLLEPLPPEKTLEDHGPFSPDPNKREGWKQQYTAFLRTVDDGKQFQLKLGSPSAIRAFGALFQGIIEQAALHDLTDETPVISLGVESFRSNNYKNYKPRFEIVRWEKNPEDTSAPAVSSGDSSDESDEEVKALPASRKRG